MTRLTDPEQIPEPSSEALLDLVEEAETAASDVAGKSDLQRTVADALEREYGGADHVLGHITINGADARDVARVVLQAIAADLRRR
jgi:aspartate/methionine/tyrosine aminotransferase